MCVNEEKYMVVSNLTDTDYKLQMRGRWIDRVNKTAGENFVIKPGAILFLVEDRV